MPVTIDCVLTTILVILVNAATSASQTLPNPSTLNSCLSSANLQPITTSSSAYTADSLAYNRRLSYDPASIVFPTTVQDVATAVKCASDADIAVAARSGGHSYAANGVGGKNGSLVIDLKYFNTVNVTASNQTAVFGTGTRLGDLALALYNGGKQAMAHGKCHRYLNKPDSPFPGRDLPVRGYWGTFRMWRLWIPV
jgi:hypothetical protein